jgi:hypothetical protein
MIRYRSDRFGFRNDDRLWDATRVDVVLIGDSYTHGDCVEEADTIAGQITRSSRSVLNLASGDNGPIHYAALAKTFLPVTSASYAVVIFYANDNAYEERSIFRRYFVKNTGAYLSDNSGVRRPPTITEKLRTLYAEAQTMAEAQLAHGEDDASSVGEQAPSVRPKMVERGHALRRATRYLALSEVRMALKDVLSKVVQPEELPWSSRLAIDVVLESCQKHGCTPVFVYIPNSEFWRPDPRANAYRAALRNYVVGRSYRAQFVDVSEEVGAHGRAAYAIAGPHLSPLGYRVVAEQLLASLHP